MFSGEGGSRAGDEERIREKLYCDNESVMMNLKNVNNSQIALTFLLNHRGLLINNGKCFSSF